MRYLGIETLSIAPAKLSRIIELVDSAEITRAAGKKVLAAVFESDVDVDKYCDEQGLNAKVDTSVIEATVDRVIAENPQAVADYKGGKVKALIALFGSCMKELKGNCDPQVLRTLLIDEINKL
jgi:aspartyl-tRNA(Asn)/glutamyl-tRNA(Gln) amidotransferase subunit B